ncbi:MAG: sterol desaturase family protein [Flammeovirgaceae bacterium]|nr:sterol desaturase family protein [Flammeovirgaceae bacterium]
MNLNPIVLSIPIFFVLIGIELVVERLSHKNLYRLPDSIANLSCGVTSQLSGLFLKILAIGVYEILFHNFAIFQLEKNWMYWVALFFLVDLAYYWAHRMSHEINLFWGGHVVHHQSEEYNLSVALRQSSFQVVWTFAFNLPLALIGFETLDFVLISALNTLYQFWIHTETINKLGFLEWFMNTPSHHRVHHGRNPKYIDKNHAGTLIIWDRMFGTFQPEEERPTYGITKPINSWNAVWANFSHYAEMGKDLKRISNWKDKIKYLFMKPGWMPENLGGYRSAPEVSKETYQKFETPASFKLNYYVLFQYILCLVGTGLFLFNQSEFSMIEKALVTIIISFTVVNCGVLFENKKWVYLAEWFRIILYPILLIVLTLLQSWPPILHLVSMSYLFISVALYYFATSHVRLQNN